SGAPPADSLAPWGSRVGAYLIDAVVEAILALVLALPLVAIVSPDNTASSVAILVATAVVILGYPTVMLATTNGKTIGKRLVGLRVVRAGGAPMTWGRAAMRELVMRGLVIGLIGTLTFGIVGILDLLWPLWDKQNQTLHDHGAETWVVRDRVS
ncbi:MAG: rane protein/domain-like protein, partial [Solirubrobacterales bacterium]|nr:rane protein/domain-like protein [Solirubrobacterales bacterium]